MTAANKPNPEEEQQGAAVRRGLLGACRLCETIPNSERLTDCHICHKLACDYCMYFTPKQVDRWTCVECHERLKAGTS